MQEVANMTKVELSEGIVYLKKEITYGEFRAIEKAPLMGATVSNGQINSDLDAAADNMLNAQVKAFFFKFVPNDGSQEVTDFSTKFIDKLSLKDGNALKTACFNALEEVKKNAGMTEEK